MKKNLLKVLTSVVLGVTTIVVQAPVRSYAESEITEKETTNTQLCVGYVPYYSDWSKVDVSKVTHLNIAFGYIYHNEQDPPVTSYDPSQTTDEDLIGTIYLHQETKNLLKQIPEMKKKNKNLKVLLSLGGWGGRGFCDSSATKESRAKLINSIIDVMNEYGLDGIDIDWETPVNGGWGAIKGDASDRTNFTALLQELRDAVGDSKLITVAAGATEYYYYQCTEFDKIGEIVDFMNMMTYSYSYGGPKYDSPLFKTSNDPNGLNTETQLQQAIKAGLPKEKIVMGTAFFGKVPTNGGPNYINPSILSSIGLPASGDYGYAYKDIKNVISNENVVERWDDEAKAPYLVYIDPTTKAESFIMQFDNEKSMLIRGRYAKDMGFGGVMVWELSQDSHSELLNS